MVEKRTAEPAHEKVVGQCVLLGNVPQRQPGAGVVTHDQRTRIGVGNESVVAAAADLHLVLVEAMPQIAGGDTEWQIEAFRIVDRKRRIGQMPALGLGYGRDDTFRGQPAPHRREFLQHGSVAIALRVSLRRDPGQAVGAGK